MDALREKFDGFYDLIKPIIFGTTAKNPEIAHHLFFDSLKMMQFFGLDDLVLNNSANKLTPKYEIANGAGFNKDGNIDPELMRLLGFDRVVVGTVTADSWKGNPKPRMKRFPNSGSMVNWLGLPGVGAYKVAKNLGKYGEHGVPLTVNLMSTPGKSGQAVLDDLAYTVSVMKDVPYVDTFELNISCPNTHGADGSIDAREENLSQLNRMFETVGKGINCGQHLYLKVSPDSTEKDVDDIVSVGSQYMVDGYTTVNTTTKHDSKYITRKMDQGGASGNAVWEASKRTQKYFADRVGDDVKLIACGGINSASRARERSSIGNCGGVQVFTGLIFEGTGLLEKLRVG